MTSWETQVSQGHLRTKLTPHGLYVGCHLRLSPAHDLFEALCWVWEKCFYAASAEKYYSKIWFLMTKRSSIKNININWGDRLTSAHKISNTFQGPSQATEDLVTKAVREFRAEKKDRDWRERRGGREIDVVMKFYLQQGNRFKGTKAILKNIKYWIIEITVWKLLKDI